MPIPIQISNTRLRLSAALAPHLVCAHTNGNKTSHASSPHAHVSHGLNAQVTMAPQNCLHKQRVTSHLPTSTARQTAIEIVPRFNPHTSLETPQITSQTGLPQRVTAPKTECQFYPRFCMPNGTRKSSSKNFHEKPQSKIKIEFVAKNSTSFLVSISQPAVLMDYTVLLALYICLLVTSSLPSQ